MLDHSYEYYGSIAGVIFGVICFYSGVHCFVFYNSKDFHTIFALNRILGGIVITVFSFYNVLICA